MSHPIHVAASTVVVGVSALAMIVTALVMGAPGLIISVVNAPTWGVTEYGIVIGLIGSQVIVVLGAIATFVFRYLDRIDAAALAIQQKLIDDKKELAAELVAETLKRNTEQSSEALGEIKKVGESNHKLLNSAMETRLINEAAVKLADDALAAHRAATANANTVEVVTEIKDAVKVVTATGLSKMAADVEVIKEDVKTVKDIVQ